VLFLSLSVIWGVPYLFIKVAVGELSPPVLVFGRTALAAFLLLPLAAARGALRHLLPVWRWVLVFAVVEIAVPFVMLGYAEQQLTSSLTALLIAVVPMVALSLSRLAGIETRIDPRRVLGLAVGFGGVVALAGLDLGSSDLPAVLAASCAVLGYALGPLLVTTKLPQVPGLGVSAVALAVNAIGYAPWAWLTRPESVAAVSVQAWTAVAVLGVVCSAVAFLVFFALVAEVGPARTTVITYVNPAVAVMLGVAVLDEPVTVGLVVGFVLVLLGSWLATARRTTTTAAVG
jgi:drug/metabolite transporter (DMT)-like permease